MRRHYTGLGLISIVGIIFIILKLTNVVTWSWTWVLLPIYGSIIAGLLICLITGLVIIACIFNNTIQWKKK
jgi:hypothetical protein